MNRLVRWSPLVLGILLCAGAADAKGKRHPCHADRQKFCKDIKPGEGRIRACLNEHQADLSAKCKAGIEKYDEMESDKK